MKEREPGVEHNTRLAGQSPDPTLAKEDEQHGLRDGSQSQQRIQIIGWIHGNMAGLRSSHKVNPQIRSRIRFDEGNPGQDTAHQKWSRSRITRHV